MRQGCIRFALVVLCSIPVCAENTTVTTSETATTSVTATAIDNTTTTTPEATSTTTSTTSTVTLPDDSDVNITSNDSNATSNDTAADSGPKYVTGAFQVEVSDCAQLRSSSGLTALKSAVAAIAQVLLEKVSSVDVVCSRRLSFLRQLAAANAQIEYVLEAAVAAAAAVEVRLEDVAAAQSQLVTAVEGAGLGVNITVVSAAAAVSDTPPTTTSTTTSTTTTTAAPVGTTSDGLPTAALVVIIVLVVVLVCLLCPALVIMQRSQMYEQRVADVRKLDDEVVQLETMSDELTTQVDIFNDKCQKERREATSFQERWSKFSVDMGKFLTEEYEPEMLRRQPAEVAHSISVTKREPTLKERLWPEMPKTAPSVVEAQRKRVGQLEKAMKEICETFGQKVREIFPGGLPELPNPGVLGSIRSEPVNASLQQEVSLLEGFTHPLLSTVTVKPHGVLGAAAGRKDPAPFTEIPAVVVDPAGWKFVGKTGDVRGAGGAAGAIYDWLGLKKTGGKFPAEVREHFSTHTEEEAETRAKFCAYNQGMYVIHVVGPKIRTVQNALHDLSRTYVNVLDEFCKVFEGPSTGGRPSSQVLRLLPVSSGIFLQNKKLERYMPEITWSSIVLALGMMPKAQQDILRQSSIEVCIFKKAEFKLYEQKLQEKKQGLELKLQENLGAVADRGGFDWVRTKNGPGDRLERLSCFTRTAFALAASGFRMPEARGGNLVELRVQPTLDGTEVVRASDYTGGRSSKKSLTHENSTVMEVAIRMQQQGKATMAVNAASAYQVGGGVMSGGRHALEETWCTMSTLLPSLQKVQWEDRRKNHSHGHHHQHIPVDACILSPAVQVFRETSAQGYRFQERPVTLTGVCSMAMFNMNSRVADSPLDAPPEFAEYCKQVKDKFKAALACMLKLKATVLVCPDVGCGVFENDPEVMGCLLGEAVLDYPAELEIVATGKIGFFEALRKTVEAEPVLPPRDSGPAPAFFQRAKPKYMPKAKAATPKATPKPPPDAPPLAEAKAVSPAAPSSTPKASAKVQAKAATPAAAPAADPKPKAAPAR